MTLELTIYIRPMCSSIISIGELARFAMLAPHTDLKPSHS
jgi:hypothetical protein